MQYLMKFLCLIIIFTISACDNKPIKSKIDNPLEGHAKALDKAKEVEQKLLEAQQRTKDAIDKASN